MENPEKLRELACWYREFAERTANSTIWDARLRTAEDLEAEAARIEQIALRPLDDDGTASSRTTRQFFSGAASAAGR